VAGLLEGAGISDDDVDDVKVKVEVNGSRPRSSATRALSAGG
jgi:hypothetical protein